MNTRPRPTHDHRVRAEAACRRESGVECHALTRAKRSVGRDTATRNLLSFTGPRRLPLGPGRHLSSRCAPGLAPIPPRTSESWIVSHGSRWRRCQRPACATAAHAAGQRSQKRWRSLERPCPCRSTAAPYHPAWRAERNAPTARARPPPTSAAFMTMKTMWTTAIFGLVGVVVGALVTGGIDFWLQWRRRPGNSRPRSG